MDVNEAKANELVEELRKLPGIRVFLHEDRSPWHAAIPLVPLEDGQWYDQVPCLYVYTEDTRATCCPQVRLWHGSVSGFDEETDPVAAVEHDWNLEFIERMHLGDTTEDVARQVYAATLILTFGAAANRKVVAP